MALERASPLMSAPCGSRKSETECIDQKEVGGRVERVDGASHGQARGLVDIDAIDRGSVHGGHGPATARSRMRSASTSRRSASSSLLSLQPSNRVASGERTTAAANTGPKSEPRPTSSTPATRGSRARAAHARTVPSQRNVSAVPARWAADTRAAADATRARAGGRLCPSARAGSTAWRGARGRCGPRRCGRSPARAAGRCARRPGRS